MRCIVCGSYVEHDDSAFHDGSVWSVCLRCYHCESMSSLPVPARLRREVTAILDRDATAAELPRPGRGTG